MTTTQSASWQENLSQLSREFESIDRFASSSREDYESVAPNRGSSSSSEEMMTADTVKDKPVSKVKVAKKARVSKRDAKVLIYLHQVLQSQKEDEIAAAQGKAIIKIDSDRYVAKPNSLSHHLYAILLAAGKDGIHINDIIDRLEQSGYQLRSQYHKYSHIHSALRRSSYMVLRMGRGKFRLRNGFIPLVRMQPDSEKTLTNSKAATIAKIPTLTDIAKHVVEQCGDEPKLTPRTVWVIMQQMNFHCNLDYLLARMRACGLVRQGKIVRPLRSDSSVVMVD
jgi:hypothetical protein